MSQDYNEAIQNPQSSFGDPELRGGQVVVGANGIPLPRSGNFADVYEFQGTSGSMWAIKCFTREVPGLQDRYTEISKHLARANLPFMVDFEYLARGVRIRGQFYPVLKMKWVEGFLLNEFARNNLDKPARLEGLGQIWLRMAMRLGEANMAHADLQHGNVIFVPGSTDRHLAVKLIDYDGMWVPALAHKPSGEVGHPAYQHPQRSRRGTYGPELDRVPLLVVACALRCLVVGGKSLWDRYDNGDNMLFREADLVMPWKSKLFQELQQLPDQQARMLVAELQKALEGNLEYAPAIYELLQEKKPANGVGPGTSRKVELKPEEPASNSRSSWNFDEASSSDLTPKGRKRGMPWWGRAAWGSVTVVIAILLFFVWRDHWTRDETQVINPKKEFVAEPFELKVEPATVMLTQGGKAKVRVTATRKNYDGPIVVELANLPALVNSEKKAIAAGENVVVLELTAGMKAAVGDTKDVAALGSSSENKIVVSALFTITILEAVAVTKIDHDREVAEWALKAGAQLNVQLEGNVKSITRVDELPNQLFSLTHIAFPDKAKLTDEDIRSIHDLPKLASLHFFRQPITGTGLAHLRNVPQLIELCFANTEITDESLIHLQKLVQLAHLHLTGNSRVTNKAFAHLEGLTNLISLNLEGTAVDDDGLIRLQKLVQLRTLQLANTKVSNKGLAQLQPLTNLNYLSLENTNVGDEGLIHLKGFSKLAFLNLVGTRVSDAGLVHLQDLTSLNHLQLTNTRVRQDGARKLKAAIPKCRIFLGTGEVFLPPIDLKNENGKATWTGELVAFDPPYNGQKIQHKNHKLFLFAMEEGKTYQIDMESKSFDSYFYLEDPDGAYLNQDDSDGNLNARILHKANKTGKHRIIATHFDGKLGQFTLTIRQKETKQSEEKPPAEVKVWVKGNEGYKYRELKIGTGRDAKDGDTVTVHYTGRLANGTRFATTDGGKGNSWQLGKGIIKGLDLGIVGMKVGGKRKLIVPPNLAYGNRRVGVIPPNSELYFEVELMVAQATLGRF
jgi:FKBP-type peptidyl-prolyl cis-trans isomerase